MKTVTSIRLDLDQTVRLRKFRTRLQLRINSSGGVVTLSSILRTALARGLDIMEREEDAYERGKKE